MNPSKVNVEKFSTFSDYWNPKIVGELNDSYVKLVKVKGEFIWHHHEKEDELFLVVSGRLLMRLRDDRQTPRGRNVRLEARPGRGKQALAVQERAELLGAIVSD